MGSGNAKLPGAPIDKGTAQQHGNQALDGLRTLGTLLISNGQFRKLRMFVSRVFDGLAKITQSQRCIDPNSRYCRRRGPESGQQGASVGRAAWPDRPAS